MSTVKCAIVGSSGSGKSTFVERLVSGEYRSEISAPIVRYVYFDRPNGTVEVCFHESPNPQYSFDMVYIFYDVTNAESADCVSRCLNMYKNVPIKCVVGTKLDLLTTSNMQKVECGDIDKFLISSRSCYKVYDLIDKSLNRVFSSH
jgi:ABC-type dipeptide/oligopeptide/nickel transport system ATPase component